jgi:exodeoxyribonuclease VII small subunit
VKPEPSRPVTPAAAAAARRPPTAAEPPAAARRPPTAAEPPAAADPSEAPPSLSGAMTHGTLTYETACARIEEIIRRLDSGDAGLRETLELCQEGRRLVEYCAGELEAVGRGLEELRLDELVARLETGRAAAA